METVIKVGELSRREIKEMDEKKGFNNIMPVECKSCGHKGTFSRRVFCAYGLKDNETDENVVRYYLKKKYDLEGFIFKVHGSSKYAEMATCPKCKSSHVIFDISKSGMNDILDKIIQSITTTDKKR